MDFDNYLDSGDDNKRALSIFLKSEKNLTGRIQIENQIIKINITTHCYQVSANGFVFGGDAQTCTVPGSKRDKAACKPSIK